MGKKFQLNLYGSGPNIACAESEKLILDASDLPAAQNERDEFCEEYAKEWFFNHYNYGWHLEEVEDA